MRLIQILEIICLVINVIWMGVQAKTYGLETFFPKPKNIWEFINYCLVVYLLFVNPIFMAGYIFIGWLIEYTAKRKKQRID